MLLADRIAEFRKSVPPVDDPYVELAKLREEFAKVQRRLHDYEKVSGEVEVFDSELVLSVGLSQELGPYIGGTLQVGEQQYIIAERVPQWIVRTFNYAARRVKDETAAKAKDAKAQAHRQKNAAQGNVG